MLQLRLRSLAIVAAVALLVPGGAKAFAASGPSVAALRSAGGAEVQDVYVRVPNSDPAIPTGQPMQVLVALHGMGGNGTDFGGALASQADAHNWLIVAPTISYGDWTNPNQIAHEDPSLIAWLYDYLSNLPQTTGLDVQPKVLLFGHSRGAQLALRFTEVHPDVVAGVAAVSAGTYTLPESTDTATGSTLNYPFGIANLAQTDGGQAFNAASFDTVPIWLGVGGADNNTADVPSAWSPYIGTTRVDRAQHFADALQSLGAEVSLTVFPNTDHTLTDEMRAAGCNALASAAPVAQNPTLG
jgi:pimeloyl-ACP methyl ester carboxylesterase